MNIPAIGNVVNSLASGNIVGALDAALGLLITPQRSIGTIYPGVTLSEVHRDDMVVTDHPVEKGAPISDHAFKRPVSVELRYAWSNSTAGYEGYVQEVYEALQQLQNSRVPFDISTGKRLYPNMLMTSLMVITDVPNEFALMVQCECREVIIAETQTVQGAAQKDHANPSATAGAGNSGLAQLTPMTSHEDAVTRSMGSLQTGGEASGGYITGGGF